MVIVFYMYTYVCVSHRQISSCPRFHVVKIDTEGADDQVCYNSTTYTLSTVSTHLLFYSIDRRGADESTKLSSPAHVSVRM